MGGFTAVGGLSTPLLFDPACYTDLKMAGFRRPPRDVERMTSLRVGNLPYSAMADDLMPLFEKYGEVGDVYFPLERDTGRSRGFAFVRYFDKRDAEDAMDALNGRQYDGRELKISVDPGRPARGNDYGRGGGGGYRRSRSRSRSRSRGRRRRSRTRSRSRSSSRSRSGGRRRRDDSRDKGRRDDSRGRDRSASRSRSR